MKRDSSIRHETPLSQYQYRPGSNLRVRSNLRLSIAKGSPLKTRGEGDVITPGFFASWRLCVRVVFETVDNVRHAVFDERDLKVDEQAEGGLSGRIRAGGIR